MLRCSVCKQIQGSGKFCTQCGGRIEEFKFDAPKGVKFKPMESIRSPEKLKTSITFLLKRIGADKKSISFVDSGTVATVSYVLDGKTYSFTSHMQSNVKNNWGAVEQFIQGRVLGIERGIESKEQAFAGYTAIPHFSSPRAILGLPENATKEMCEDAFRKYAKFSHPDQGGDREQFSKISSAIQDIRSEHD